MLGVRNRIIIAISTAIVLALGCTIFLPWKFRKLFHLSKMEEDIIILSVQLIDVENFVESVVQ